MTKLFEGKVAVVTGGASGIGQASALAFAREGAHVVIADLDETGGRETAAQIERAGVKALFVRTDVSKAADVAAMVDTTMQTFGRLDAALNNAGTTGSFATVAECTEEDFDRAMAINAKGVFLCMKYEIPAMLKGGGGAIVNTSSGAGERYVPRMAGYVASKHAIIGLTRSAAGDFIKQNIRVNAILPGPTDTPMIARGAKGIERPNLGATLPIGRMGTADEQAEAVIWLCSQRSSFIVGVPLAVDGGLVNLGR